MVGDRLGVVIKRQSVHRSITRWAHFQDMRCVGTRLGGGGGGARDLEYILFLDGQRFNCHLYVAFTLL